MIAESVLRWLATGESPVLYVFALFFFSVVQIIAPEFGLKSPETASCHLLRANPGIDVMTKNSNWETYRARHG